MKSEMERICEYSNQYGEGIIRMILQIQQEEYNLSITADDQPDLADIEAFYRQDGGNFWVALDGEEVVGTIAIKSIGNGFGALRKMFVKKEYRGRDKGISGALLSHLLYWTKGQGFSKIYLGTTPQFVAAHRFYEKNGFQEINMDELPASFPIMGVDKKFYCYIL